MTTRLRPTHHRRPPVPAALATEWWSRELNEIWREVLASDLNDGAKDILWAGLVELYPVLAMHAEREAKGRGDVRH